MYICEKCGSVFEEPVTKGEPGERWDECPDCGCEYFEEAFMCKGCGEYFARDDLSGYNRRLFCRHCIGERKDDIDFLAGATSDTEEIEIPVLYRYIFTDDDIHAMLYRAAKELQGYGDFDASDYIDDYANDIAEALDTEMGGAA